MLVNHQYKRKYPIFPIVENTTLKNSDPSELRTTGSLGPRKEEEENNCGRTSEVIEHPIAAPDLCLSTQCVRILTCGCTYLRVSIIVFIHYIQTEACTAHRLERLPSMQGQVRGPTDPKHALIVPSFFIHALSNNFKLGAFSPGP